MPERSLREWLSLLEARHPAEIELGLERIAAVADRIVLPPPAARTLVVAGTNGKGSCVRTLEDYAGRAGFRVGTYTSPHLLRFNERIRIAGVEADDDTLCEAFERVEAARGDTPLTYFETVTLAAMVTMGAAELDLAVLEVGLGGRFDAVNIVDADLAIITSIDLDHTVWLGETREEIGYEKACVARPGHPVVCGDRDPPVSVVRYLEQLGCRVFYLGKDFEGTVSGNTLDLRLAQVREGGASPLALPLPALPVDSVIAAFQALSALGIELQPDLVAATCREVTLAGRCQALEYRGKQVLLDVAHNPAAASHLAQRLAHAPGRVLAVAAIMADKDLDGFVDALMPVVDDWFLGDLAGVERALPATGFAQLLYSRGVRANLRDGIEEAFADAVAAAEAPDTVLVCGSFYTVSAILTIVGGAGNHV